MGRKIIRCLFLGLMLAVFLLVFTDSTIWTKGNVIITGPIDSIEFQDLVDSVAPGTTIECLGGLYKCYQGKSKKHKTYPIRITKPLRIVAADEKEPPIFIGTGYLGLSPVENGNNCFVVYNLTSDLEGLEFMGLHFKDFRRALTFIPAYDPEYPTEPIEAGVLSNLKIARCNVSNCYRGIEVWGKQTKKFDIWDNIISEGIGHGIIIYGSTTGYDSDIYNPGRPENGTVYGNVVTSRFGIVVDGCERVTVYDNIVGGLVGIFFGDDVALDFTDDGPIHVGSVCSNEIQTTFIGIWCSGPTTLYESLVQKNFISNTFYGISLEFGANRFNLVNNEFLNSLISDVWLWGESYAPASHDNTVIATDFVTTVVDEGINNKLVGTLAMIHNPGVPDDVRQKLEELRAELAELIQH